MSEKDQNRTTDETAASIETAPAPKKAPAKWIIILAALIVIIGGVITFATVFKKSPKQLYLISEVNTYQKAADELETKYSETMAYQEKAMKQPSTTNATIKGGFNMDSLSYDPSFKMIQDLISKAEIKIKAEQDPKKSEAYGSLALNIGGSKALDIEGFQTKERIGFKAPILANEYFYLNLDEYGQVARKFDPSYSGPETLDINTSNVSLEDLKLTEKEKTYIAKEYGTFIYDQLDSDYFTKEKNVDYKTNGKTLQLTSVTLNMSDKETKQFMDKLIAKVAKDDKLHTIYANHVSKLFKSSAATNPELKDMADPKELKKSVKESLQDFQKDAKDITYPGGVKSTVYVQDDVVVARDMNMGLKNASDDKGKINVVTKNVPYEDNKTAKQFKTVLTENSTDDVLTFDMKNDVTTESEKRKENMSIHVLTKDPKDEDTNMTFKMNSVINGKTDAKQTADRTFSLDLGDQEDLVINGEVKQNQAISASKGKADYSFDIRTKIGPKADPANVTLKIDSASQLKKSAAIPELDASNATNVKDVTPEDMLSIQENFAKNVQGLMMNMGTAGY